MGRNFGQEVMQFQFIGFEKEKVQAYVKNQEQLDGLGFDEKGGF